MDYREHEPAPGFRHLIKSGWMLSVSADGSDWVRHEATPDGCIEIIRRLAGRSRWGAEQPETFVAGLGTRPAQIELGAGSRFVALRIWPWAWNALAALPGPRLIDRWTDLREAAPGFVMPKDVETALGAFSALTLDPETESLAFSVLSSRNVEELAARSGRSRRWLQRWFARHVGVAPRLYLRLLRFQETLAGLQDGDGSLADQAADHGFADQAHMAREFRTLAGASAGAARRRARGPFI